MVKKQDAMKTVLLRQYVDRSSNFVSEQRLGKRCRRGGERGRKAAGRGAIKDVQVVLALCLIDGRRALSPLTRS